MPRGAVDWTIPIVVGFELSVCRAVQLQLHSVQSDAATSDSFALPVAYSSHLPPAQPKEECNQRCVTGFQSDFRIMVSNVLDSLCHVQVLSWAHLLDHALALARLSVSVSVRTPAPFLPRPPLPPDILHHTVHNSVAAHRHLIPAAALRSEPSQRQG